MFQRLCNIYLICSLCKVPQLVLFHFYHSIYGDYIIEYFVPRPKRGCLWAGVSVMQTFEGYAKLFFGPGAKNYRQQSKNFHPKLIYSKITKKKFLKFHLLSCRNCLKMYHYFSFLSI